MKLDFVKLDFVKNIVRVDPLVKYGCLENNPLYGIIRVAMPSKKGEQQLTATGHLEAGYTAGTVK